MTDFCPACGYYLYDGECQGCGSVFTEEALRSMSRVATDVHEFPSPQEHAALTNSGWYQHSKELGDPYPVYYKNGSKYIHILQYKPVGENNWHLFHAYSGGRGAEVEGPPLPEPTSHSRLVGQMGENTVGERLKKINIDRETSPVYDPYLPSTKNLFERLNFTNPGVLRFSDSTKSEDLIYDGPVQQPSWFAVPEYDVERVDPTEDTSKSVKTVRDADVSVENGAPGRLAAKQKAVGDKVHAHCPEGHSGAIKINENAYRCLVCGKQWVSKNSSVSSPRESLQSEGWDYRGRFRTPIGVGDRYMKSGSIFRGLQTVHEITHASSNGEDLFKYRVGLLLPSNKSVSWLPDEHFGHSSGTLDSIRSKISQNESRFKDTSEIKKTVPMTPKDTIDLARRMNEPKGSLEAPIHTLSWQSIGQSKGNQGDGLNFSGLRPGNWSREHDHDSEDKGLEEGWREGLEVDSPVLESEASHKEAEVSDDEIHRWMGDLTPSGHKIPDWGSTEDDVDDIQGEKLPWVPQSDHEFLTSRGFQVNWDGDYTKAFNTDYRGGHLHDHTITPHEQGDYEHYVRFNHPDLEDSFDYVGNSAHLNDILSNVEKFEQEGSSKSPALFDPRRESTFLSSLNSGPTGRYARVS